MGRSVVLAHQPLLLWAGASEKVILAVFLFVPQLVDLLGTTPNLTGWLLAAAAVPAVLLADTVHKAVRQVVETNPPPLMDHAAHRDDMGQVGAVHFAIGLSVSSDDYGRRSISRRICSSRSACANKRPRHGRPARYPTPVWERWARRNPRRLPARSRR